MSCNSPNLNKIIGMINNSFETSYKCIFEEVEHILEEDIPVSKLQLNECNIISIFSQIISKLSSISDFSIHLSFLCCYCKFLEKYEIEEEICLGVTNYMRNIIMKWSEMSNGVENVEIKQYCQV